MLELQTLLPYTLTLVNSSGMNATIDASACAGDVLGVTAMGAPSPMPTSSPAPPTPFPVTGTQSGVTIYPYGPWQGTCAIKATDTASHEADLTITMTKGQINVHGGARR